MPSTTVGMGCFGTKIRSFGDINGDGKAKECFFNSDYQNDTVLAWCQTPL